MSIERRSCVHPFIEQAQNAFNEGESLKEMLGTIRDYQKKVSNLITNISPEARIPHMIGVSVVGLTTLATYEYLRVQGIPLPDSREIVGSIPVASMTIGNGLTREERRWAKQMRKDRDLNPEYREQDNTHRRHAYGIVDQRLEAGEITPEKASELKRNWDKRHGY